MIWEYLKGILYDTVHSIDESRVLIKAQVDRFKLQYHNLDKLREDQVPLGTSKWNGWMDGRTNE